MRSVRHVSTALGAAALVSLFSSAVLAEPTAREWAEWKRLRQSAQTAMHAGRAGDAVDALRRADSIHKSPTVDLELGLALAAAGKLVEARSVLGALAASTDPGVLVKRARDAAKKALVNLTPRVPSLEVTVSGAGGAQVEVTIDGAKVSTGSAVEVNPGEHTVRATADGFSAAERSVRVAEGRRAPVTLELVAPNAVARSAKDVPGSSGSRVPGAVVLSVGGAGLIVGAIFGGLAMSAAGSAKEHCLGNDCTPAASDDISRSKTFGDVSTGMFIGGGVVAVVGIVLTIVAPGGKDTAGVAPFIGPATVGLAGRF